jgi:NodT family efflux transporter outer membrane factor (OMF) lipoprotein
MVKQFGFLLLGVWLISGCLAPPYGRTPGEVPGSYRFQSLDGEPRPELASLADLAWWEMFDDPVLQELIGTALAQNYDVRLAMARVTEARAQAGVSRSFLWPQVDGTGIYRRQRISRNSVEPPIPPNVDRTNDFAQFNFDLFWEIDLFGRLKHLSDAAQSLFFASEWGRQAVLSAVVADVARAYFELRTLDFQLEISRATLESFERSRHLVALRYRQGLVSGEELAQAEALVHIAGVRIPDLERLIAQTENQIGILLGDNPQPILRGKPLAELAVRPEVPAGLPSDLLERRPDIRQSEAVLMAANYRIGSARANFFPRIALTGQAGTQSVDLSELFTGASSFWNIGPIATLPIFTGGFNYFNLKATEAQKEQALTLYQFTVRQAFREVSDGLVAHDQFKKVLVEQQALVESYRRYAVLANKRFKGGLESFLTVLDSERQLFSAKLDLAAVQRDRLLTLVQLYKALGGGTELLDEPEVTGDATSSVNTANQTTASGAKAP